MSMETTETAMETNGDGSGGTSPSRQGAGTETFVPQNSSVAAAELQYYSRKNADCFRVFRREALYRRRGVVRSGPGGSHHSWARPGAGPRPLMVRLPFGPPPALFRSPSFVRENRSFGLRFVQFREYFLCSFSETQNSRKQGTGTVASR
jgi:hypothetical protein